MTNQDQTYTYYTDPAHGWLAVPMSELKALGIERKITDYSYMTEDGTTAFLEEDVDMPTFMEALGVDHLKQIRVLEVPSDYASPIRNFPSFGI